MTDENDTRLEEVQAEAVELACNAEATARAFNAVNALTDVFDRERRRQVTIDHADLLCEQLQRLTKIMNDWYASRR